MLNPTFFNDEFLTNIANFQTPTNYIKQKFQIVLDSLLPYPKGHLDYEKCRRVIKSTSLTMNHESGQELVIKNSIVTINNINCYRMLALNYKCRTLLAFCFGIEIEKCQVQDYAIDGFSEIVEKQRKFIDRAIHGKEHVFTENFLFGKIKNLHAIQDIFDTLNKYPFKSTYAITFHKKITTEQEAKTLLDFTNIYKMPYLAEQLCEYFLNKTEATISRVSYYDNRVIIKTPTTLSEVTLAALQQIKKTDVRVSFSKKLTSKL